MHRRPASPLPFAPPNSAEAEAIRAVGRYLNRAADVVGTRLLQSGLPRDEAIFLDAVREQARAGAALCEGLLDLAESLDRCR
jgi:hypothetical protein